MTMPGTGKVADMNVDYDNEISILRRMAGTLSRRWSRADGTLNYIPLVVGLLNEANYITIWMGIDKYAVQNFDEAREMMSKWTKRQMIELGFPETVMAFVA